MNSDEKKCPRCAEIVKAEAKVCRHCGYDFETGKAPEQRSAEAASTEKSKQGLFGCLALVVIVVVVLAIFGGGSDGSEGGSSAPAADAEPPLAVTAQQLAAAYEANEAAAQQQYGNRRLQVTGTVTGVELDIMNDPVVQLASTNEFMSVQANLDEASQAKASSLTKGDSITMICSGVGEVIGMPILQGCSF